jgi:serine/threonine protein kinase
VFLGTARPKVGLPVTVAVKTRDTLDLDVEERMLIEARLLHIAAHPRIVRLLHIVSYTLPAMLCLEYMANGDLKSYLRACRPSLPQPKQVLTEADFFSILQGVCDALAHLHRLHLLHRDIAARNVRKTPKKKEKKKKKKKAGTRRKGERERERKGLKKGGGREREREIE